MSALSVNHIRCRFHGLSRRTVANIAFGAALLLLAVPGQVTPVLAADDPPVFLDKWGSYGTGPGQFNDPWGIAIDPDGNVWVADYQNSRVQKFTSDGDFLASWGSGGGLGQFWYPIGVAADSDGNIYVTDRNNFRVQKYNADTEIWSAFVSGFNKPGGIAVAGDGKVFVINFIDQRIEVFDSGGASLTTFGGSGTGNGQFTNATAIAVDSGGAVYVADSTIEAGGPSRVQKFEWDPNTGTAGEYVYVTQFSSKGSSDGQTFGIHGIVVDPDGGVYVTDWYNGRVQKFVYNTGSGAYEMALKWGTAGGGDGQFFKPMGIALHPNGDIYTTEEGTDRVQVFTYRTVSLSLKTGWNMVSMPLTLDPEHDSPADAFPGAIAVYWWDPILKSYVVPETIVPEVGYWVAVTGDTTITVIGTPAESWTGHPLKAGWNMVGSVRGSTVNVSDLQDEPSGALIDNAVYWWNPVTKSYDSKSQVEEGLGYWMAVTADCTLCMQPSG